MAICSYCRCRFAVMEDEDPEGCPRCGYSPWEDRDADTDSTPDTTDDTDTDTPEEEDA